MADDQTDKRDLKETLNSWISFSGAYRIFGLVLLILGLSFYVGWSIMYNTWADSGLYSVTVMFVVFGILSVLLGHEKSKHPK